MPIEIRELHIKGSVFGNNVITEKKLQSNNSPLLNTQFVDRLKKDIIKECTEHILDKIERQNLR